MNPTVLFIPSFYYSSHPVLFPVADELAGCGRVYFNTKDERCWAYNQWGIKKLEVLKHFDSYLEFKGEPTQLSGRPKTLRMMKRCKGEIQQLRSMLEAISPSVIVSTSDMLYTNRICNQWARQRNVPVIILQPAFLAPESPSLPLRHKAYYYLFNKLLGIPLYRKQAYFGNESLHHNLVLWGDYFKKFYQGKAIYPNIQTMGNPAFDAFLKQEPGKKMASPLWEELNIDRHKRLVVICTQDIDTLTDVPTLERVVDLYRHAIADNPQMFFILKVHPRETVEKYSSRLGDLPSRNFRIIRDVNLFNLFYIASLQVSVCSYASFEAVVLGVPIVLVNPNNELRLFDYFQNAIELRASTPEQLSLQLRQAMSAEYQQEFPRRREEYLKSRLAFLDGRCAERIARKILDLAEEARR